MYGAPQRLANELVRQRNNQNNFCKIKIPSFTRGTRLLSVKGQLLSLQDYYPAVYLVQVRFIPENSQSPAVCIANGIWSRISLFHLITLQTNYYRAPSPRVQLDRHCFKYLKEKITSELYAFFKIQRPEEWKEENATNICATILAVSHIKYKKIMMHSISLSFRIHLF